MMGSVVSIAIRNVKLGKPKSQQYTHIHRHAYIQAYIGQLVHTLEYHISISCGSYTTISDIRDSTHSPISSFLTGRTQKVVVEGSSSDRVLVVSGSLKAQSWAISVLVV